MDRRDHEPYQLEPRYPVETMVSLDGLRARVVSIHSQGRKGLWSDAVSPYIVCIEDENSELHHQYFGVREDQLKPWTENNQPHRPTWEELRRIAEKKKKRRRRK